MSKSIYYVFITYDIQSSITTKLSKTRTIELTNTMKDSFQLLSPYIYYSIFPAATWSQWFLTVALPIIINSIVQYLKNLQNNEPNFEDFWLRYGKNINDYITPYFKIHDNSSKRQGLVDIKNVNIVFRGASIIFSFFLHHLVNRFIHHPQLYQEILNVLSPYDTFVTLITNSRFFINNQSIQFFFDPIKMNEMISMTIEKNMHGTFVASYKQNKQHTLIFSFIRNDGTIKKRQLNEQIKKIVNFLPHNTYITQIFKFNQSGKRILLYDYLNLKNENENGNGNQSINKNNTEIDDEDKEIIKNAKISYQKYQSFHPNSWRNYFRENIFQYLGYGFIKNRIGLPNYITSPATSPEKNN